MARPTLLTDKLHTEIVALVEKGNFPETAAVASGVPRSTFYDWTSRGRRGESPYSDFLDAIERARAVAEGRAVERVEAGAELDPKHAQWLLERRSSERWASKIRVTVEQQLTAAIDALAREFADEPETLDRILATLRAVDDLGAEANAREDRGGAAGSAPSGAADEPAR